MPRKSTIKTLPPEMLDEVNRLLSDDSMTLDDLAAYLAERGHARSRSALGRHKKQLDQVAEKLRRSREMANALVKEIGPDATEGKTSRLLVEILQSLAFDFLIKRAGEGDEEMGAIEFARLGKALKDMASAQKIDLDRELKIRQETATKAATAAGKVAGEKGLTADTIDAIKEAVLGVSRP